MRDDLLAVQEPNTLNIREYRDSDKEAVLKLHELAMAEIGAYKGPGPWNDDLEDIPNPGHIDLTDASHPFV